MTPLFLFVTLFVFLPMVRWPLRCLPQMYGHNSRVRTQGELRLLPPAGTAPTVHVPLACPSQVSSPLSLHCSFLLQMSLSQYLAVHGQVETVVGFLRH